MGFLDGLCPLLSSLSSLALFLRHGSRNVLEGLLPLSILNELLQPFVKDVGQLCSLIMQ